MGVSDQILGLRDRKKIKTRETIRREAMRLIDENGYVNTTIEQIAEAAEVSPSTFFRYFPSKEMVLMANDLDLVTIEALEQQRRHASATLAQARGQREAGEPRSAAGREGFASDADRLVHRFNQLVSLAANVCDVFAAILTGDLRHRD